jgi:hypothetical protein
MLFSQKTRLENEQEERRKVKANINAKQSSNKWYLGIARQGIYPASLQHSDSRK